MFPHIRWLQNGPQNRSTSKMSVQQRQSTKNNSWVISLRRAFSNIALCWQKCSDLRSFCRNSRTLWSRWEWRRSRRKWMKSKRSSGLNYLYKPFLQILAWHGSPQHIEQLFLEWRYENIAPQPLVLRWLQQTFSRLTPVKCGFPNVLFSNSELLRSTVQYAAVFQRFCDKALEE